MYILLFLSIIIEIVIGLFLLCKKDMPKNFQTTCGIVVLCCLSFQVVYVFI